MSGLKRLRGGGRRRLATSAAAVLAVASLVLFALGFSRQHHAPRPPASVAIPGPVTPSTGGSVSSKPAPEPGSQNAATPTPTPTPTPTVQPTAITIPAIGVGHSLLSLGLNPDGTLQVPAMSDVAFPAWYHGSPVPGQNGPAVIVGHIDSPSGAKGVFYGLGALRPGDTVSVDRSDGSTATFRVDGVTEYAKNAFPTLTVYGNTPNAQLRLITCGGGFDHRTQHYLDDIVVYATLTGIHSPAAAAASATAPDAAPDPGPSATSQMVCGPEIRGDVASILGLTTLPATSTTWSDHLYTCTYNLPAGRLVLTVKESPDAAGANAYFTALRQRTPMAATLDGAKGLGDPGFESPDGIVVITKDGKTLRVDATGMPAASGPDKIAPADLAYEITTDILGCWTGK